MTIKWRWVLPLLAVAIAAGAYVVVNRPAAVEVAPARIGPAVEVVYATGFIEAEQPVEVASRVTAPVVAVMADEGDRVVRGQALARLESGEQRQTIAQLAAQTASAAAEERRTVELFRRGYATAAARDRVVLASRAARATEAAARERLDQYTLRAGISGVVLRRDVEPGDLATSNRTLFVLGDPKLLKITATVDERDIPRVRAGQQALMSTDAFPGRIFKGRVREVTPGGDPDQRAFRVRITPERGFDLPVGLTLEVNIVTAEKPRALLVPANAVRDQAVWAAVDDRARKIDVRTGIQGTDATEILSGLRAGACVVVNPPEGLEDGARIKAKGC